jgi:hypothetical protein
VALVVKIEPAPRYKSCADNWATEKNRSSRNLVLKFSFKILDK